MRSPTRHTGLAYGLILGAALPASLAMVSPPAWRWGLVLAALGMMAAAAWQMARAMQALRAGPAEPDAGAGGR